jgi:formylglycine-generating enzyme required for sulfatase activity
MKRLLKVLPGLIAGIAGALFLAGCSNQFSSAPEASGQGLVTIHIGNGEQARTLFPQPVFSRYELQFTPEEGQAAKESESFTNASPAVTLAAGEWTITAIAYVEIDGVDGIESGEYEAARGSNSLTVSAEQDNSVGINIGGDIEDGEGVFSYAISYPAGANTAALKILSPSDGSLIEEVDLLIAGASGAFVLDAGYYILQLELEKGGGTISQVEVIHIYKSMTTAAAGTDYTFTDADLLFTVDTDTDITAGTMTGYAAGDVFFSMAAVPGRISFPTGTDDLGTATVRVPYQIAETEVTWELWNTVRTWALENGYSNITEGVKGDYGSGNDRHPVAGLDSYSVLLWCNALTEYWNEKNPGTSLVPVYNNSDGEPLRGDTYNMYVTLTPVPNARGFRLPTNNEWELAARWQGESDLGNSVERDGRYYTSGNSASGAFGPYTDAAATGAAAVYSGSTAEVKTKAANALGLYDMSGNIEELCFEWSSLAEGSSYTNRGGSCVDNNQLQVGYRASPYGSGGGAYWGLRLARTGYKNGEIVLPPEVNAPIGIHFTGPEDESFIITGIEQYHPSWPVLQNNVWYDDSDPVKYYQFYADAGASYSINWNDSFSGDESKTADIGVSAYWKADNASIFVRTDSGWTFPQTFTASRSGIVVLKVEHYNGGNTTGTFALKYSGSGGSGSPDSISQADSLTLSAPAGYAAYLWIVDDDLNAGSEASLTLQGSTLSLGPHTVTLVVYKGDLPVPYSKEISFTVEP